MIPAPKTHKYLPLWFQSSCIETCRQGSPCKVLPEHHPPDVDKGNEEVEGERDAARLKGQAVDTVA